ncbi:hypothetical protein AMAG_01420 [Allomyces macrogynus ATCC 38327]|uniref:Uncharacterized protein n=1 Tax=Allomyces macrogynus (strain ATCC 38327) TaxID=578462 RepID=A0A0L0RZQ6_ALLM3|nr:hypothetical protein AMAG_01420 [Allomyces macrogynus ATCC 38327]|eukprot:KNE55534.1 hypothetical protein AMAG_01420 [Allomyces macrogynus ATCC 38327]
MTTQPPALVFTELPPELRDAIALRLADPIDWLTLAKACRALAKQFIGASPDCTFPARWLEKWVPIWAADRDRRGHVARDPKPAPVRVTTEWRPWTVDGVAWLSVYDRVHLLSHNTEMLEDEWIWPLDVSDPRILLRAVKLATARKIPLPSNLLVRMCAPPPIVVRDRFVRRPQMPRCAWVLHFALPTATRHLLELAPVVDENVAHVVDAWWEPLLSDEEFADEEPDLFFSGSSRLSIYFGAVRFAWETARFQYGTFVVGVFRTVFDGLQAARVASGKPRIDEAMHARLRAVVRRSINTHSEMVTVDPAGNAVLVQRDELPAWT